MSNAVKENEKRFGKRVPLTSRKREKNKPRGNNKRLVLMEGGGSSGLACVFLLRSLDYFPAQSAATRAEIFRTPQSYIA